MTSLTPKQHTVLARLSDEQWRTGRNLDAHPKVLAALNEKGLIRGADFGRFGTQGENWTITPSGLAALANAEAAA